MKSKYTILYEDDAMIAIDKPSGLLSIPNRSQNEPNAYQMLQKTHPDLKLVHRLDRETSGVLLFAKGEDNQRAISNQWEAQKVVKTYHALLSKKPHNASGTIESYIEEIPNQKGKYRIAYQNQGKRAVSHYRVLESYRIGAWTEWKIDTGRTHQIRVHAAHLGTPLAYDPIYNPSNGIFVSNLKSKFKPSEKEERSIIQRLSLHASQLELTHPVTNEVIVIESPLPNDLTKSIKILEKYTLL